MELVDNRMFSLNGDFNQVLLQWTYLKTECIGFDIAYEAGFYPQIKSEKEYERALSCFWLDKTEGWWNYKDHLIKYLICTEEEFNNVLREQVERKRVIYEYE